MKKIFPLTISRSYSVVVKVAPSPSCFHRHTHIEILEEDSSHPAQILVCNDCDETILNLADEREDYEYEYED